MSLSWLTALLLAAPTVDVDCDARYAELAATVAELDYQSFDQTPGSGFRILAEAGCPRQAADLIEHYVARTGASEASLTWHVAQLRGEAGQTEAAISAALASLRQNEPKDAEFRWNAHVHAYLAFLQQDRAAFDQALAELLAHVSKHQGNAVNAGLWRRLEPHFEQGYVEAVRLGLSDLQR